MRRLAHEHRRSWKAAGRLGMGLSLALLAMSCRAKVDVNGREGAEPASEPSTGTQAATQTDTGSDGPPPSVDTPGGLSLEGGRRIFQSRETIVVAVDYRVMKDATTYSLINVTDPENPVTLVGDEPVPAPGERLGLAVVDPTADRLLVYFHPTEERGALFRFGTNKLRVEAHGSPAPRHAVVEVVVRDYPLFEPALSSFEDDLETADGEGGVRFQGWLNTLSPAVVATTADDAGATLGSGLNPLVNGMRPSQ